MASKLKKYYGTVFNNITIENAGAEGNCVARAEGLVIFVPFAAPGDVADIKITGTKKKYLIGEIQHLIQPSVTRTNAVCSHFGICGGCKWQHLTYAEQLRWKQQVVKDAFERMHKLPVNTLKPIIGSVKNLAYRNKLEFSFSSSRWILNHEPENASKNAAGFHIPGRFDKVLDIEQCFLQDDLNNQIRNFIKSKALQMGLSFYHPKEQKGYLRNLIIRNNRQNQWMVILITGDKDTGPAIKILDELTATFHQIKSCYLTVNTKLNDAIYDLPLILHSGEKVLKEELCGLKLSIRPKSFFQPNTTQAEVLYKTAIDAAGLIGKETVYDLYCGTGTITMLLAAKAKKVIGIESVPQAIDDAHENALENKIDNLNFEVGDMQKIFTKDMIEKYGKPEVIVTDPPRNGMHPDVVKQISDIYPEKIVYVSCNPATQARDILLLHDKYEINQIIPVDMFPHTHHVENIVLLCRR